MEIHLCNEVVRELDFAAQCRFVRETGYDGLEVAPFTLAEDPSTLSERQIARFRKIAADEGVRVAGLHWLLAAPAGLSITADDAVVAERTHDFGRKLIEICHGLGGTYLVHGSPAQRVLGDGGESGRERGTAYFAAMAEPAAEAGMLYCIEPLSRRDTDFVNTVDEAVDIIRTIGSPALATMIDCYAAANNGEDIVALLRRWIPEGSVRHVHLNDPNRRGPGEGALAFGSVIDVLCELDYAGAAAVEPFDYRPDGPACAARAIGYLRGLFEKSGRTNSP